MIAIPSGGSTSRTAEPPWPCPAPAWLCGLSSSVHRAGLSVSELKAEITVEAAIVKANCL